MFKCQYCLNPNISEVLYLGALPPVNDMHESGGTQEMVSSFPLPFCHCEICELTQIGVSLNREIVFPRSYPYLSGMTKSLLENFRLQAEQVNSYLVLNKEDLVLDIGSNDGSLLRNYSNLARVIGIEPTQAADTANKLSITTLNMYFDVDSVRIVKEKYGRARVVTACNVFAHIDDIPNLMSNIAEVMTDDGIFVSESHYLLDLVNTLQFDTIYHEHLRYYTVTFLKKMFNDFGLEIFRVDSISTHGGSIRVWASKKGKHQILDSVQNFLSMEKISKITDIDTLKKFAQDVVLWRNSFRALLAELISSGAKVGALGSPSRASTLLAFAGVTELDLYGVGEVSQSSKIGRDMPGTRIPVVTESELLSSNPTHLLILSWHIKEPIMKSLRKMGFEGSFIIPLPIPQVVR